MPLTLAAELLNRVRLESYRQQGSVTGDFGGVRGRCFRREDFVIVP